MAQSKIGVPNPNAQIAVPFANSERETKRDESKNDDWDLGTHPAERKIDGPAKFMFLQRLRKPQQR